MDNESSAIRVLLRLDEGGPIGFNVQTKALKLSPCLTVEQLLQNAIYKFAGSVEVMELATELMGEATKLLQASQAQSRESYRALRRLKLFQFLKLHREAAAQHLDSCRRFNQSCQLLARADRNVANARSIYDQFGAE